MGSRGNRYSSERHKFYKNYLAMRDTADVTGGKPIAVWSQSISGVRSINAFYDICGRKGEVLFFYFVPDTTRDQDVLIHTYIHTAHALFSKGKQRHLRYSSETPTFYQKMY
jgi:hypothetical protein